MVDRMVYPPGVNRCAGEFDIYNHFPNQAVTPDITISGIGLSCSILKVGFNYKSNRLLTMSLIQSAV
jgi:hypothetical protein